MLKNTVVEIRVYYCVFIKMSCNPHAVVQILLNEMTQNYPADNTHTTYIDRRIARELIIILEKYVSGGMDMSEGQTLWCDSDGTWTLYLKITMCSVVQFMLKTNQSIFGRTRGKTVPKCTDPP